MESRFSIPSLFLILFSTFVYGNNTEPVITLNGPNPQYVDSGGVYEELGAVAYDNEDGSLTDQIVISGSVNTNYPGNYTIQYVVTDSDGNSTVMNRTVIVENISSILISKTSTITQNDSNSTVDIGDQINYTIVVTNDGNTVLTGINITDTLTTIGGTSLSLDAVPVFVSSTDANTTFTSDPNTSVPTLQIGESVTYTATFTVNQAAIDAGGVKNTVIVTATADDADNTSVADTTDSPVITTITQSPAIEVTMVGVVDHVTGTDSETTTGDTIVYTITIENTGNVTITDIDITDTMTDGAGQSLTRTSPSTFSTYTLAPGATEEIQATYTIEHSTADTGSISNTVNVVGTAPDGTEVSDDIDAPVVVLTDLSPSIEVINSAIIYDGYDDGYNGLGDTIEFSISIENTGNVTLSDVYITDNLTALNGDSLILTSGPTFVSNGYGSTEGTLQPGETSTYVATYVISQQAVDAGGVSFTAIATASTTNGFEDVMTVSNSTNIETYTNSSLAVTKEVAQIIDNGDGFNGSGDIIDYTITITNTGNLTLNNVTIQDSLYDGYGNFISELTPFFVGSNKAGSQQGVLQVGETSSYSAQYTIDQAASDSELVRNTVTVTANDPSGNEILVSDFVEITVASFSIEVLKTWELSSDLDNDGIVDDGDTIRFIVSVKNTGNVEVTGITLEDTFSDGAGNLVSFDNGTTTDPRPLNFTGADQASSEGVLLVGETATYEAFYTVTTPVYNTGFVSNSVTAIGYASQGVEIADVSDDGDDTDGNTENDPTVTTFTSQPIDNENILLNGNVYITKSNGLIIKSGDDCYRIKVNNGNVVAELVNCEQ